MNACYHIDDDGSSVTVPHCPTSQPVGSSQVVLESTQADGSSARRVVECMTHAVVPLVLDTVKRAIEVDDEAEALT